MTDSDRPTRLDRVVPIVAGAAVLGLGVVLFRGAACGERPQYGPVRVTSAPARPVDAPARSGRLPPAAIRASPAPPAPADTGPALGLAAFRALVGAPQIDPLQPDYDPVAAYQLAGAGNVLGLFNSEPRDEAWASQREADIAGFVTPELQSDDPAAKVEVECRTATCRIHLVAPWASAHSSPGDWPIVCLADRTTPMWGSMGAAPDDEDPYPNYFLVFDREARGRDGFLKRRGASCADFREEWRRTVEAAGAAP